MSGPEVHWLDYQRGAPHAVVPVPDFLRTSDSTRVTCEECLRYVTEAREQALAQLTTLGAEVTFTWHLTRHSEREKPPGEQWSKWRKVWRASHWLGQTEPAWKVGVLVGLRTLTDGVNDMGGYDEPTTYSPEHAFPAALVAYDLRRKPVLCLPEHVRPRPPQLTIGEATGA